MVNKRKNLPSQTEVDHLISQPKIINLNKMNWFSKPPSNPKPIWMQSTLDVSDINRCVIPNFKIMIQYRPKQLALHGDSVKFSIIDFYNSHRIYAFDPYPFDKHTNKKNITHPEFKNTVVGPHYHVYFEVTNGVDIAFPLITDLVSHDLIGYWTLFCQHLNILSEGNLIHPFIPGID